MIETPPPDRPRLRLLGLFQHRVAGDDALLELARLRFAQAGLGAELYADTPDELAHVLPFVPPHRELPFVHLSRSLNVLYEPGLAQVAAFAGRFPGRLGGLVVHDRADMAGRLDDLVGGLRALDRLLGDAPGRPPVFVEYAAGHPLDWFVELGERLRDLEHVSVCIDIGHVGVRRARAEFARLRPGLDLFLLSPADPRLPDVVAEVREAAAAALPAVLSLTRSLGALGKPVHLHLHDGHPLVRGLSDHLSFLTRVPIPFASEGRRSLPLMYGPSGLASVLRAAGEALGPDRASFTLEIHQVEGRQPLGDGALLFGHWRDLTNAERMNHWLAVLAENAVLAESSVALPAAAVTADSQRPPGRA